MYRYCARMLQHRVAITDETIKYDTIFLQAGDLGL